MSKYFSQHSLPRSASVTMVFNEIPSGLIDGSNDTFSLAYMPISGNVSLFKNGVAQLPGTGNDYVTSGQTITFEPNNLPQVGDNLLAIYQRS